MTTRLKCLAVVLSVTTATCARSEARVDHVPLTMRPVGDSVWELDYRDADGDSRLRVRPRLRVVSDSEPIVATTWTLYTVPGSEPGALLGALARAHGNPAKFRLGTPTDSMRVNVALLAVNAVRSSEGTFIGAGKGTWIAAKLFLGDGDAELYLNLDPARGEAEFVTKDEEAGPIVLQEISSLRSDSAHVSSSKD